MDEIDEILGTNDKNNSNKEQKQYKKLDFKKLNSDRQEAYNTMENMTKKIKVDANMFKQYLDVQSRFDKYSVGNCLIILNSQPDAIQFKDMESWNEKGINLKPNPKVIKILEPQKSKTNDKIYFNPKEVYDISQTDAQNEDIKIEYDTRELLKSFLHKCTIQTKAVDTLSNGEKGAEYNRNENILYVCKGMDNRLMFQTISQELANIELKNEDNTEYKDFKCYCISYMICKKYGIDISNYNFDNLPDTISKDNDSKHIRYNLEEIRATYETINSRIADYFKMSEKDKQKQNKNQER